MSDLQKIVAGLKELETERRKCMRCGFCQNYCPMFGETHREYDVSRGKVALLNNMANQLLTDVDGLADRLDRCLLCGSCTANCPSAAPTLNIFVKARALVAEYKGLSPIKKMIFRTLLPNPKGFDWALKAGAIGQGLIFSKNKNSVQKTAKAPLLSPLIGDRHIVPLPAKPLHEIYPNLDVPSGASGIRVLFYPGCVSDRMYTNVGEACIRVLKHHGVGIIFPADMACCGMPSLASGDTRGFEMQVRKNLTVIGGLVYDYIITPCGSCTSAIKEMWKEMGQFTEAEREQIKTISSKVMDINAFLVDVIGVKPAETKSDAVSVTYHDPCHLKKGLGIGSQPRDLIMANPGYTIKEMSEPDRCCGCGGSFNLFHYDVSQKIGQKKRDMVVETGASVVATACPACMMQLIDTLSRNGDPVEVKHSIELYAESL